jgi:hypothetical protein
MQEAVAGRTVAAGRPDRHPLAARRGRWPRGRASGLSRCSLSRMNLPVSLVRSLRWARARRASPSAEFQPILLTAGRSSSGWGWPGPSCRAGSGAGADQGLDCWPVCIPPASLSVRRPRSHRRHGRQSGCVGAAPPGRRRTTRRQDEDPRHASPGACCHSWICNQFRLPHLFSRASLQVTVKALEPGSGPAPLGQPQTRIESGY